MELCIRNNTSPCVLDRVVSAGYLLTFSLVLMYTFCIICINYSFNVYIAYTPPVFWFKLAELHSILVIGYRGRPKICGQCIIYYLPLIFNAFQTISKRWTVKKRAQIPMPKLDSTNKN